LERQFRSAFNRALKRLAVRQRSRDEIESDLAEKGFEREVVSGVVKELLARGLIDDRLLARDLVLFGQRTNRGRSRIYADLRKRGISRSQAEESLEQFYDYQAERRSIEHLLEFTPLNKSCALDRTQRDKIVRRLCARGFPPDAVRDAIWEMTCEKEGHKAG
jgi:regulatory protein